MILIDLVKKAGVVLKTSNKYCNEDIKITPALEDIVIPTYDHGKTITPPNGKVGFGSVKAEAYTEITLSEPTIDVSSDGVVTAAVKSQSYGTYLLKPNQTATKTHQLPTEGSIIIVPKKDSQVAVKAGIFTTGDVTITAIPDKYVDMNEIPKQGAAVITPTHETQIAVQSGVYTTGVVTVAPIPDNYVDMDEIPKQGDTFVTPTNETQIAVQSGVYTTGDVTVAAIPDNYVDKNEVAILNTCSLNIHVTGGPFDMELVFTSVNESGAIETTVLNSVSGGTPTYKVPVGSYIMINSLDATAEWANTATVTELSLGFSSDIRVFQINKTARLNIS